MDYDYISGGDEKIATNFRVETYLDTLIPDEEVILNPVEDIVMFILFKSEAFELLKKISVSPTFYHPKFLSKLYITENPYIPPKIPCPDNKSFWLMIPMIKPICIDVEKYYTSIYEKYK
jgi:hypothetical protein